MQSCDAAPPAVQSVIPGRTQGPTAQVPIPPHGPPTTALPAEQTPDPLAISPKGTRMGDSYFDFPPVFWFDIWEPPFSECIYLSILSIRKQLDRCLPLGQFQYKDVEVLYNIFISCQ